MSEPQEFERAYADTRRYSRDYHLKFTFSHPLSPIVSFLSEGGGNVTRIRLMHFRKVIEVLFRSISVSTI